MNDFPLRFHTSVEMIERSGRDEGRDEGRDVVLQLAVYEQDSIYKGRDSSKNEKIVFWKAFALNAMRVCVN